METTGTTATRCACGRRMRPERAARVGACATCEGTGDGRARERGARFTLSDPQTPFRIAPDAARAVWGAAGVYGDAQRPCEHRGVCRHAPRTDVGIAYVWNARRGAYDYTPVGVTTPIPTHTRDRTPHARTAIGRRGGVCERCDKSRDEHPATCNYRPRIDAIAGDARAFVVDDVAAYVAAFRARA